MDAAVPSATHRSTTVQPILVMAVDVLLKLYYPFAGYVLIKERRGCDLFELATQILL
jgi:hypothetical protein